MLHLNSVHCKLYGAESVRGSDQQREAKAEGSPRLMPTSDQQQQMAAMQERAPRLLLTCTAQRTAARFLLLVLYSCLLRCFSRAGAAAATALAYILKLLASQVLSLPHGSWCRLATTAAAGAPVAQLWNMHLGACVFIIVMFLPSSWLWWPPKKSEDKLLEKLVEVESWAMDNIDVLRDRDGDCFKAKLRQLKGGEEKRIYFFLTNHKERIRGSPALEAQLANLDCIVMALGDTSLHAAVPSAASGSRKARCVIDAGLSAQEEGKKRAKTEARGQTGSAGRSDSCGSAGASNSDFPMIKDSIVRNTLWRYAVGNTGAMGSAVSMSTSSGSGQARGSSSTAAACEMLSEQFHGTCRQRCGGAMPPRGPGTSSRTIPPPNGSPKLVQLFQLPAQLRVAPEENVFRRAAVTGLLGKRWLELVGAP